MKTFLQVTAAITALFLLSCVWFSRGPDYQLDFSRDIRTEMAPAELARKLSNMQEWPKWFHHLETIEVVSENGTDRELKPTEAPVIGEKLRLFMNPKKGPRSHFEILVRVSDYVPGQRLALNVLSDSKGRLDHLFEDLKWTIALVPADGKATWLRGEATATTKHWRSRLFGRMTPRIFMNQVYYLDLMSLGGLTPPHLDQDYF